MPEKFCADHMLGKLCKWLRFMGFDVTYPGSEATDSEILEECEREGRIILTRDHELYSRSANSILIESVSLPEQLRQVTNQFSPDRSLYFSRCPECNNILRSASSKETMEDVPLHVREQGKEIWMCDRCGKKYWHGSHYDRILTTLMEYGAGK